MRNKQNTFFLVILSMVLLGAIWFFMGGANAEHIEDTNGPDNYSLAVITEEDITAKGIKTAKGGPHTSTSHTTILGVTFTDGTKYYSDKFSGIYILDQSYLFAGSDLQVDLYGFELTGGNLQIFVVLDGVIYDTLIPENHSGDINYVVYDLPGGDYQLVLAGESAAFEFTAFDFND